MNKGILLTLWSFNLHAESSSANNMATIIGNEQRMQLVEDSINNRISFSTPSLTTTTTTTTAEAGTTSTSSAASERNYWDIMLYSNNNNNNNDANANKDDASLAAELRSIMEAGKANVPSEKLSSILRESGSNAEIKQKSKRSCPSSGILFFTRVTKAAPRSIYCNMLETIARFNIPLNILGYGKKVEGFSHLAKYVEMIDIIKESISDDCIVMFNDADVYYQRPPEYYKQKYLESIERHNGHRHLLVSAECACWPNLIWMQDGHKFCYEDFPKSPTKLRFINSGGYIGYAKEILELLTQLVYNRTYIDYIRQNRNKLGYGMNNQYKWDFYDCDQELMQSAYFYKNPLIKLDHHASIFLPLGDWDHWQGRPESKADCPPAMREISLDSNSQVWAIKRKLIMPGYSSDESLLIPAVLHFNGFAKDNFGVKSNFIFKKVQNQQEAEKLKKFPYHFVNVNNKFDFHLNFEEICQTHFQ